MPPRTIDNLGVEVSTRYAEDQLFLDEKIVKESRTIPSQTTIDVTIPSYSSEVDALVHSEATQHIWANFFAPLKYQEQKGRLFSYQILPSLGSEEKKEVQMQKILAKLKSLADKRIEEKEKQEQKKRESWLLEKEAEEEEKEKKALTSLFETISLLDKFLIDINSRRSQYQKG